MLFGKRRKKNDPNERVLNLKARVDALRQADEASRTPEQAPPQSLDHFLAGDDVLTGREVEDTYDPATRNRSAEQYEGFEVDLEAELQKYLQRQEAQTQEQDGEPFSFEERPSRLDSTSPSAPTDPPGDRPLWLTPFPEEQPPSAPRSPWPESSDAAWPASKEWPSEDEWPPGDEKAV